MSNDLTDICKKLIEKGDLNTVRVLVGEAYMQTNPDELMVHTIRLKVGDLDFLEFLLGKGADPTIGLRFVETVYFEGIGGVKEAELMLAHGAKINHPPLINHPPFSMSNMHLYQLLTKAYFKKRSESEPKPEPEPEPEQEESTIFTEDVKREACENVKEVFSEGLGMFGMKFDDAGMENLVDGIFKMLKPMEPQMKEFTQNLEAMFETPQKEEKKVAEEMQEEYEDDDNARIIVIHKGSKIEDVLNEVISVHKDLHSE